MSQAEDIDNILNPLLSSFNASLKHTVDGHIVTSFISGSAQMTKFAGLPFEGPPMQQALSYASKQGARLVTEMDTTTKERLARIISNGIKEKRGVPGLARDIRGTFTDMTKYRSKLIARTETAQALSQGSLERMEEIGVEGKEWVTAGDSLVSAECMANEGQGVIAVDKAFISGAMAPPQHPNCRCSVAPARFKK